MFYRRACTSGTHFVTMHTTASIMSKSSRAPAIPRAMAKRSAQKNNFHVNKIFFFPLISVRCSNGQSQCSLDFFCREILVTAPNCPSSGMQLDMLR